MSRINNLLNPPPPKELTQIERDFLCVATDFNQWIEF